MDVFAADSLDEPSEGPHANAPAVTGVGSSSDLVVPLPLFLVGDRPEVFGTPDQRYTSVLVDELGAHSMSSIMVALEIAIAGTFTWALFDCCGAESEERSDSLDSHDISCSNLVYKLIKFP